MGSLFLFGRTLAGNKVVAVGAGVGDGAGLLAVVGDDDTVSAGGA